MVAIRPTAVKGNVGQKFVVTRRFSGDGYEFKIGDVIIARQEWVHKVPQFVDQRFLSPFLSAEDEEKTPVNLELAIEATLEPKESPDAKTAKVTVKVTVVPPEEEKDIKDEKDAKEEGEGSEGKTDGEGSGDTDEDEIDLLAASLLT